MQKFLALAQQFARHPVAAYDQALASIDGRLEHLWIKRPELDNTPLIDALEGVGEALNTDVVSLLDETPLHNIRQHCEAVAEKVDNDTAYGLKTRMEFQFANCLYAVCRALKPQVVLETGVAYGVSSAFILQALAENGSGVLHSIDRPVWWVQDSQTYMGIMIPEHLKVRWHLHLGTSKRLLPQLLPQIGPVDCFVHDSLHTYHNMAREYHTVTPHLNRPALLFSDDVHRNQAYTDWLAQQQPAFSATLSSDGVRHFGIALVK